MTTLWKLILVCCIHAIVFAACHNLDEYVNVEWQNREEETLTDIPLEQSAVPMATVDTTTPYQKKSLVDPVVGTQNSISKDGFDQLLFHSDGANDNSCLLDSIKTTLMWWTFPNGTLRRLNFNIPPIINYVDLSYRHISSDDAFFVKIGALEVNEIVVFSAAYNNLTSVPQRTLGLISRSLKYLTLSGNNFYATSLEMQNDVVNRIETNNSNNNIDNGENISRIHTNSSRDNLEHSQHYKNGHFNVNFTLFSKSGEGIAWAKFPHLPNLIELDVSNCQIEFVAKDAFRNLSNLKSLYISHNKMLTIPFDTFYHVESLQYLDLSHTNVFDYSYQISTPTLEAIVNMVYGLKIQQSTFKYLPKLVYLDLSHTKLTRNSAVAFTHLGENLKYLSLCDTAFPMVGNALFKNTALVGLDLSGNTYAAYNMIDDAFEGISNTLSVLYFERSNLKDISWIKCLSNLRVLGLAGNNINSVTFDMFSAVSSLQVLDLSVNHVGNWYTRVFTNNSNLRILNLSDNNINIITSEMLKDFSVLDYLSIGNNNFVCDCMLRDLVDLATSNTKKYKCARSLIVDAHTIINANFNSLYGKSLQMADLMERLNAFELGKRFSKVNISSIMLSESLSRIRHKIEKTGSITSLKNQNKMQFVFKSLRTTMSPKTCLSTETQSTANNGTVNGFLLKFQLLDYQEEHYWCFNETEKISFLQLSCHQRSFADDFATQVHNLTVYVISCVCTLLVISIIGVIIYFKRWHIYYYYSSLKSAALLSEAVKENVDKLSTLSRNESSMVFDIFISYCQNDREWVFKELMPNIEETGDITICLHERDFQIGVTILDNIISCMDRSRGLMLIISSNFLLSHWCQFEMHLAQHRIFDASNDHLILVFLEDIPRNKRPKNLQYLMDVKTYIKWPGAKSKKEIRLEDYKLFWKRLRRTLHGICN